MTSWADILKQVSYSQMSSLRAHSSRFSATDLCGGPYSSIRLLRNHHTHFQAKWLVPALVPLFKLWAPFWVGGGLDALVWWLTGHAGAFPRCWPCMQTSHRKSIILGQPRAYLCTVRHGGVFYRITVKRRPASWQWTLVSSEKVLMGHSLKSNMNHMRAT